MTSPRRPSPLFWPAAIFAGLMLPVIYVAIHPTFLPLYKEANRLDADIAEARRLNVYPDNASLHSKYPFPKEDNAADAYATAVRIARSLGAPRLREVDHLTGLMMERIKNSPPRPDLQDLGPLQSEIIRASQMGHYQLPVEPVDVAEANGEDLFDIKAFSRLLAAEAIWAAQRRDFAAVRTNYAAIQHIRNHMEQTRALNGLTLTEGIQGMAAKGLERMLQNAPSDPEVIALVQELAKQNDHAARMDRALEYEAAFELDSVRKKSQDLASEAGPLDWERRWTAAAAQDRMVRFWKDILVTAEKSPSNWEVISDEALKMENKFRTLDGVGHILGDFLGAASTGINSVRFGLEQNRMTIAIASAAQYAHEHGEFPESLPDALLDSGTAEPLIYRKDGRTAYVWPSAASRGTSAPGGGSGKVSTLNLGPTVP